MKDEEKTIKTKIIAQYCRAKPGSLLDQLRATIGDEAVIRLLDNFSGRVIYVPNQSSLRRAALPMLIRGELEDLEPDSTEFKARVKLLSDFYKLTQKAIRKINNKGVYTR